MSKVRYLFIELKVQNGEYEYSMKTVVETKAESLWLVATKYAAGFYDTLSWRNNDSWFFNGGEVATRVRTYFEITQQEYNILKKYL